MQEHEIIKSLKECGIATLMLGPESSLDLADSSSSIWMERPPPTGFVSYLLLQAGLEREPSYTEHLDEIQGAISGISGLDIWHLFIRLNIENLDGLEEQN